MKRKNIKKISSSNYLNLTFLDLSDNLLEGPIPDSFFSNQTKLEYLNLSTNSFGGPLSENFTKLSNLKELRLINNSFSGNIPSALGQLKNLHWLDLRMNALDSTIPPELGHCTYLIFWDLAGNSLSGPLPLSFSNLINLSDLGLSDNSLSGDISPSIFAGWINLTSLQFQNNRFTGDIPPEIGLHTNLQYLFLYNNSSADIDQRRREFLELMLKKSLEWCHTHFVEHLSGNARGDLRPQIDWLDRNTTNVKEGRAEASVVVFEKSRVRPKDVGVLVLNCILFNPTSLLSPPW